MNRLIEHKNRQPFSAVVYCLRAATGNVLCNFFGLYFCTAKLVIPWPEPTTPTLPSTESGLLKMLLKGVMAR